MGDRTDEYDSHVSSEEQERGWLPVGQMKVTAKCHGGRGEETKRAVGPMKVTAKCHGSIEEERVDR